MKKLIRFARNTANSIKEGFEDLQLSEKRSLSRNLIKIGVGILVFSGLTVFAFADNCSNFNLDLVTCSNTSGCTLTQDGTADCTDKCLSYGTQETCEAHANPDPQYCVWSGSCAYGGGFSDCSTQDSSLYGCQLIDYRCDDNSPVAGICSGTYGSPPSGVPSISSGQVSTLYSRLTSATNDLLDFFVTTSLIWVIVAGSLVIYSVLRSYLRLRKIKPIRSKL